MNLKPRETLLYETYDGLTYRFHAPPTKTIIAQTGWAAPPFDYSRSRGPYQHGETAISTRVNPRTISVNIRHQSKSRSDYWDRRGTFLDFLRVNRSNLNDPSRGTLHLVINKSDGTYVKRSASVFVKSGPECTSPYEGDHWSFQETVEFECLDPLLYDPTIHSQNLIIGNNVITYAGTFETYPTIYIAGACTNPSVRNNEADTQIVLAYVMVAMDTTFFYLDYSDKRIEDGTGASLISYVAPSSSDVVNFCLQPAPLVAGGVNTIQVATAAGAPTVLMTWYDRYWGV